MAALGVLGVVAFWFSNARADGIAPADFHVVGILTDLAARSDPEVPSVDRTVEERVTEALAHSGLEVHGSNEHRAIEAEIGRAAGGWFNPYTGELDASKLATMADRVREAFRERYKLDGFVSIGVEGRTVDFEDANRIVWDGAASNIVEKQGIFAAGGNRVQWIRVIS